VQHVQEMATGDLIKLPLPKGAWLYHATYFGRLEGILAAGGLAPGHGMGGATFGQQYMAWSRGKLFVARASRALFWYSRLDAWAQHNGPEFPDLTGEEDSDEEDSDEGVDLDELQDEWRTAHADWTVVVLRYRDHGKHPWSPQYEEDHENADDYYWTDRSKKVPAKLIQVWNPINGNWIPGLTQSTVHGLAGSLDRMMDASLKRSPDGFGWGYSPNIGKLQSRLDEGSYTHSGGEKFWGDAGDPLTEAVYYHGTNADPFDQFDAAKIGSSTDAGLLGRGFYFSTDRNIGRSKRTLLRVSLHFLNPLKITTTSWQTDKLRLVNDALGVKGLRAAALTRVLLLKGYDAVVLDYSPLGYHHQEVMVPKESQIKGTALVEAEWGTGAHAMMTEAFTRKGSKLIGYKIMRYDPNTKRAVSGANSRINLDLRRGAVHRMPHPGIFMAADKRYVIDHYMIHDVNALITYAFAPGDVQSGSLEDREPEIAVNKATVLDVQIYDDEGDPLTEAEWGTGAHAITTDAGGEGFWGNAGAGVLPIARSTGRILAGLRSAHVNEPRTWGIFGGAIDSGENPRTAAKREMREELGYHGNVMLLPAYVFTSPGGGFRYSNFIGVVDEEFDPKLDWETERVEWMSLSKFLKLQPKHFGLEALLKHSMALIRQNAKVEESVSKSYWDILSKPGDIGFDIIGASQDLADELEAGKVTPDEAGRWLAAARKAGKANAVAVGDAYWDDDDMASLLRAVSAEKELKPILQRVRGKRVAHVRLKRSGSAITDFVIHPSTRRSGYTIQISEFNKGMTPYGHRDRKGTIEDALREIWREDGPFTLVDVSESLKKVVALAETRILSREEFRELSQMRKDVVAGRRKASEILAFIDARWTPSEVKSDMMLPSMHNWAEGRVVWDREKLDKVRNGIAVKTAGGDVRYITRSVRGDAPAGKPWQLTRGSMHGGSFVPHGHDNHSSMKAAFLDAWDWDGPLKIIDIVEAARGVTEAFEYGLRFRPPGPGAVPKGFTKIGTHPRFRHGTVSYDRELTSKEVYDFELEPLFGQVGKGAALLAAPRPTSIRELKSFAAKVMREFPALKGVLLGVVDDAKENVADGDDEKQAAGFAYQAIAQKLGTSESLQERSFVLGDIPKNFRVVFDLGTSAEYGDAKAWKALALGRFDDIRGISDTGLIEPQFLGVARNAVMVMPGKAFASTNKVTRILYDNPNYMLSKDAWALRRIFQASTYNREQAIQHAFRNLLEYMFARMKKAGKHVDVVYAAEYRVVWGKMADLIAGSGQLIDGVNSTIKILRTTIGKMDKYLPAVVRDKMLGWPTQEWAHWIDAAIKFIASTYKSEGEWVVKGDSLHIPPGSTLRVLVGGEKDIPDAVWQRYVRLFGYSGKKPESQLDLPKEDRVPASHPASFWGWEYALAERGYLLGRLKDLGITKKYRVEFVHSREFKAAQQKWWATRERGGGYEAPAGNVIERAPTGVRNPLDEVRVSPDAANVILGNMRGKRDFQVGLDTAGNVVFDNDIYAAHGGFTGAMRRGSPISVAPRHRMVTVLTRGNPTIDPALHKLLQAVVKIAPDVGKLKFDAGRQISPPHHGPLTVNDWLAMGLRSVRGNIKLPVMYHGTSTMFADHIKKFGLKPRGEYGATSHDASGTKPSNPNYLYLATSYGVASAAASASRSKHGGHSVVYQVEVPDPAKLRPDEDAEEFFGTDWTLSLSKFGTVAYEGRIASSYIKPHSIWGPRGWQSWSGDVVESIGEDDYVGDPNMATSLKRAGFRSMGQAKQAARARRGQAKLDKLPPPVRKKLLDPKRKDLLLDKNRDEASLDLDEVKIPTGAARLLHGGDGLRVGINKTSGELDLSGYLSTFGKGLGVVYVTHPNENSWTKGGSVDIESAVTDPHTVETLKALVRVDPNIGKYLITRNYSGDVNSFIHKLDRQRFEPSTKDLPALYHGTSSKFAPALKQFGLRPRGATGTAPTYGGANKPSIKDRVYVGILSIAQEAARQAANMHGGVPVVYRIVLANSAALEPDEDSKQPTWWRSLKKIGAVAHVGRIPAKFLHPYKAWPKEDNQKWVGWNGRAFKPEEEWESESARDARWKASEAARKAREYAYAESIDEAIPAHARTTFDAAPYANMRILDVARLLHGAAAQATPSVKLIEKLIDRLIHALEFTIYSIHGRPEGRMVGDLIRSAFNTLTLRLPELALEDRQKATFMLSTLSESLDDLAFGPAAPPVRAAV